MFTFSACMILAACGTLAAPVDVDQAVAREFRLYRIQVYSTYRTWRSEYDRRCVAGEAAYAAWQAAGASPQQAHELQAWYRGAKFASLAQINQPLPALPQFSAPVPTAIAAAPPPSDTFPSPKRIARVERYTVRRLEDGAAPRVALQAADPVRASREPRPSWKSVSSALYKGVVFGASRVLPK